MEIEATRTPLSSWWMPAVVGSSVPKEDEKLSCDERINNNGAKGKNFPAWLQAEYASSYNQERNMQSVDTEGCGVQSAR